ncbi:MAG: thiamine pyrophosphate-dependent enzyme, partial [Acidobacteriota bacterium]
MTEDIAAPSPVPRRVWYKALAPDALADGRVTTVTCGVHTLCMTRVGDRYAALDNRCPHQGGPLGEGSIENGLLRCPWHGWDYDPLTGRSPGEFDDGVETFPVEIRDDGVYVGLLEDAPHVETVSDVIAKTLVNWGVTSLFGMVGHSNLGLADALRMRAEDGEMRYVGIRHEGAASFACSAYGKLTGRPAACLTIAGPGATNLLTGLWDANVDRAPVVALTGQVDTQVLGPGAFQEVDLVAAFGKVAQWSQAVLHTSRHAELANLACKSAILNRGVSHLIFPDEVQTLPAGERATPGGPEGRLTPRTIAPPVDALDAAVARIRGAERPVIIVGHGARFTMGPVIDLAERLGAPILTTFKGKGLISDHHPLGAGVLGRSGTPIASWFMNESDLLLVFGASFSNHTGITPKKPIVQVDYDAMTLGKFHAVDVPVWGEIGITAHAMLDALSAGEIAAGPKQRKEIAWRWSIWREEKRRRRADDRGEGVNAAALFDALERQIADDAILAVDVGNNTYSFGRYFECTAQAVLMSGYLGSIGFSLPAALGAWAATQEDDPRFAGRQVVSISGDGGFGQYMGELLTAVKYDMNLTHVLMNNGELGKISKEQRAGDWPVWQTSLHNPDFAAYARLCGAHGVRVERVDQLDDALAAALAHAGPALVEVMTDAPRRLASSVRISISISVMRS